MQPVDKPLASNPGQMKTGGGPKSFVDIARGILEKHGFHSTDRINVRLRDCDIDGSGNNTQHLAISNLKTQPVSNTRKGALTRAISEITTQTGLPVPYKITDAPNSSFNIELSYSTTKT
jgi:hypothetical protein